MNGHFSSLGALFLVAWLAAGGFAVFTYLRQPQPTLWHWVALTLGVVMLASGVLSASLGIYALWRIRR